MRRLAGCFARQPIGTGIHERREGGLPAGKPCRRWRGAGRCVRWSGSWTSCRGSSRRPGDRPVASCRGSRRQRPDERTSMKSEASTAELRTMRKVRRWGMVCWLSALPLVFSPFVFKGTLASYGLESKVVAIRIMAAWLFLCLAYMGIVLRCPRCGRNLTAQKFAVERGQAVRDEARCPRCELLVGPML